MLDVLARIETRLRADQAAEERTVGLRGSDAGRCVLEKAASMRGLADLPVSFFTLWMRFRLGHIVGEDAANLLIAALAHEPGVVKCVPEFEVDYRGVKGHIDVLVFYEDRVWPVEYKSNYFSGGVVKAKPYQALQNAFYAIAAEAQTGLPCPTFSVVTISPAATEGKPWMRQDDFATDEYREAVEHEYFVRLAKATGSELPEGDPNEPWRCKYCLYSGCKRNVNPANPRRMVS